MEGFITNQDGETKSNKINLWKWWNIYQGSSYTSSILAIETHEQKMDNWIAYDRIYHWTACWNLNL
jgi:hypothetical protein